MGAIKRLVKLYRVGWLLVGFSACLPASRFLKSTKDFLPSTYTRAAQANGSSRDATLGYRTFGSIVADFWLRQLTVILWRGRVRPPATHACDCRRRIESFDHSTFTLSSNFATTAETWCA